MDDSVFERWSQALEKLRRERREELERVLTEKADGFKPAEFYEGAVRSLETTMERWLAFEQEAPPTSTKALQTVRVEMESIVDFELDAIDRDVAMITSRITWYPDEMAEESKNFRALAEEIRKKYLIKLKNLSPAEIKNPLPSEPLRAVQFMGSSARAGSGLAAVLMFFVGLLLGGGMSIYYRDAQHKAEARFQDEKQKLLADERALSDGMALLHSSYADLVTGRSKPIPELQAEMARIQKMIDDKIAEVNAESAGQRAHLNKKLSGDRLERALAEVERDRKRRVKKIEDEYGPSLRVYDKRILLYKDLLSDQAS
jgi:hypothetical protein